MPTRSRRLHSSFCRRSRPAARRSCNSCAITGVTLATLTGLLQFGDYHHLVWIWLVFVVASILEGYVFVPWLVGDRIGLHPVAVIFALLAFGELFGFFGVLLALPASAALLVGVRHLRAAYLASRLYGGN